MWILTSAKTGEVFCLINKKKEYKVGRFQGDLILKDDNSISRSHAVLYLVCDEDGSDDSRVEVEDEKSSYGTFLNNAIDKDDNLAKKGRIPLKDGDRIRFGVLGNEWKITKKNLNTAYSNLSNENTAQLRQYMEELGGKAFTEWNDDCDYLTMHEITITVKVMYALLKGVPIVNCEYWHDLLRSCRGITAELPNPRNYLPDCSESFVGVQKSEFSERPDRQQLFEGKRFVFMNRKHFEIYKPIIEKAGGQTLNLNAGIQSSLLIAPGTIVVQYIPLSESQTSQALNSITDLLKKHNKRIILEYEIGLAILLCSTERYCNPDNKILSSTNGCSGSTVEGSETVFAGNTSFPCTQTDNKDSDVFVDETEENGGKEEESMNFKKRSESMPKICVTESACADSQGKRKRSNEKVLPLAHSTAKPIPSESEDDQDFFAFTKRPHLDNPSKRNTRKQVSSPDNEDENMDFADNLNTASGNTRKTRSSNQLETPTSSSKALSNVAVTRAKQTTTSTQGFLGKKIANNANNALNDKNEQSKDKDANPKSLRGNTTKRKHIAVLSDNEDANNEDLFCFTSGPTSTRRGLNVSSPKKTRKGNLSTVDSLESADFLNFTEKPKRNNSSKVSKETSAGSSQISNAAEIDEPDYEADIATEPYIPKTKNSKPINAVPLKVEAKPIPAKESSIGWLCCSLQEAKLKGEEDGENDDIKPPLGLEGGCVVLQTSVKSIIGSRKRCLRNVQNLLPNASTSSQVNSGKNFKKFVKQKFTRLDNSGPTSQD